MIDLKSSPFESPSVSAYVPPSEKPPTAIRVRSIWQRS